MVLRMDKRYIDQHEAYMLIKHEAETRELPASKEAYERAARIVDQMRPVNIAIMEQKTAYWIDVFGDVPIYNAGGFTEKRKIGVKCSNCQRLNTWCEFDYCPHCGARMEVEE